MLDKYLKKIKKKLPALTRPIRGYFKNKRVLAEIRNCTGQPIKKVDGKIYVIGDSHSNFFSGEEEILSIRFRKGIHTGNHLIPFFRTFHIGPALAFNLSRMNTTSQAREKILYLMEHQIPPRAAILLCFGEIDCRVHILRQAEKNTLRAEDVIDGILDNYFTLVNDLKCKGFRIICWGPIASQKECWNQNPDFPRYGTEVGRNKITEIFNHKLEERCRNHGVKFCSIFRHLISQDYLTDEQYISDQCHLSQRAMKFGHQRTGRQGRHPDRQNPKNRDHRRVLTNKRDLLAGPFFVFDFDKACLFLQVSLYRFNTKHQICTLLYCITLQLIYS